MSWVSDVTNVIGHALGAAVAWAGVPWWALLGGVVAGLVLVVRLVRGSRRRATAPDGAQSSGEGSVLDRDRGGRRASVALTILAALLVEIGSATGMWNFFGDVLHITGLMRVISFATFEVVLAVSAVRATLIAREHIRRIQRTREDDDPGVNIHQVIVWVAAVLTGVFSATDMTAGSAKFFRVVLPLMAALVWAAGESSDLDGARRQAGLSARRQRVTWRMTWARVLVWLGLAEPEADARDLSDVARDRSLDALTRALYRANLAPRLLRPAAAWWARRLALRGAGRMGLGTDPVTGEALRLRLAALYQITQATTPAAVAHLAPWGPAGDVDQDQDAQAPALQGAPASLAIEPAAPVVPVDSAPVTVAETAPVTTEVPVTSGTGHSAETGRTATGKTGRTKTVTGRPATAKTGRTDTARTTETGHTAPVETGALRRSAEDIRAAVLAGLGAGTLSATSSKTALREVLALSWKSAQVWHEQLPALAAQVVLSPGQTSIEDELERITDAQGEVAQAFLAVAEDDLSGPDTQELDLVFDLGEQPTGDTGVDITGGAGVARVLEAVA
jgi:hypothetical protein